MKVVVTGASGLLGRAIFRTFKENGANLNVTGTCLSRPHPELTVLDLTDPKAVTEFIDGSSPDLVIHSAAVRTPDTCENDRETTTRINVDATRNLVEACHPSNIPLIYISTDYVFPGTNPPYSPDDTPEPLNFYGMSKRMGEEVVVQSQSPAAVLRVPVLYGEVENLGESAVTEIAKCLLDDSKTCVLDDWATRYPTHVEDVALVLLNFCRILENSGKLPTGIFHWSANQALTKFQMAQIMAKALGRPTHHLKGNPQAPPGPLRPRNTQLDTSATLNLVTNPQRDFSEAIFLSIKDFF